MEVYVIQYDTGEYSDRREEVIGCYTNESLANSHCELANQWLRDRGLHFDNTENRYGRESKDPNPYHPSFDGYVDYTGGGYHTYSIVLFDDTFLCLAKGFDDGDGLAQAMYLDRLRERGQERDAIHIESILKRNQGK